MPFPAAKAQLARLYGLEFPDSLFLLHEFLAGLPQEERPSRFSGVGMEPIGALQLLACPEAESQRLQPTVPWLLHWRFFRDPPEFHPCLFGDQDGLRWGLLYDEPAKGFRGAASFYHNGHSEITVYPSLFAAVLSRIKDRTSTSEPEDPEERAHHRKQQDRLRRFSETLHRFIQDRQIPLDDGRGKGLPCDTGLDLQPAGEGEDWFSGVLGEWSVFPPTDHPRIIHLGRLKERTEIGRLVRDAVAASENGRALPALSLGRSLWYWGSDGRLANSSPEYSAVAHDLLKRAYSILDRPALLRVLDIHYKQRELAEVDLFKS